MYRPRHFAMTDDEALDLAAEVGLGHLVTIRGSRPDSSLIPFLIDRAEHRVVVHAHIARANPQRHAIDAGGVGMLIVQGPDAYVSPSHYPSKREHGRMVPTWNYAVVHLHGRLRPIEDHARLRTLVAQLTDRHERELDAPWSVDDAPSEFIDGQLRAIIGFELLVDSIEGKAKLSQNRSDPDHDAVRDALLGGNESRRAVGELMR